MASLRVKDQGRGPVIYARWRDGSRLVEQAVGRGWLVGDGEAGAKPNGATIGRWRERRGRPPADHLTVQQAIQRIPEVQRAREAEQARTVLKQRREKGEGITLAEAAERFLAWGEQGDPHTERDPWKHAYAKNTRSYVGRIVRELGPDRRLDAITFADLSAFMTGLAPERNGKATGTKPSRKFLSNYALPLKGLWAYARRMGWIEEDVALELPSYKPHGKAAADPLRRNEYLTSEEVRAVVGELGGEQDRAMVLTMAMAGLRPGECVALTWESVDYKASTLRVVESRTMGVTGSPKSGHGRSVPMPPEVAQALKGVSKRGVLTGSGDLVFIGALAGHVDMDALRERFNVAQDAAKILPRRELRQLRNTFGTVMAGAGAPMRTLQQWMGHSAITTTERYASFMPRDRDAALVSAAFALDAQAMA
jgi:integrase